MKKIFLFLSVIVFTLCVTSCDKLSNYSNKKNKGTFAKDIPKCLKKMIKDNTCITRVEEYCNVTGGKRIYYLEKHPSVCIPAVFTYWWVDEDCKGFSIYPNETVEYSGETYYFKRDVFITKCELYERY